MQLKSFIKFVELPTKIASVVPFLMGILYTLVRFNTLKPLVILFFFISMLSFDMFTTGLNNYMDYKRAVKKEGYNYEMHNGIVQFNLKERTLLITLVVLFLVACAFGVVTFLL
ncbi:MAG: 1,4-dihydroxy-2-naphthoate polyprenyltransferase, partial [Clostridia bacterium]|nr:1,4-dihydroxy-2-naphthoate polyprenyltransferase [Clostridia bacterium]